MNEPSPYRYRFDDAFCNKTKNTVSCNVVIDIQELNRATVIICAELSTLFFLAHCFFSLIYCFFLSLCALTYCY